MPKKIENEDDNLPAKTAGKEPTTTMTNEAATEVRSLTVATFATAKERKAIGLKLKENEKVLLGLIQGVVSATKSYTNKMTGESDTKFVGRFGGTVTETGETFISDVCYLPSGLTTKLEAACEMTEADVSFQFKIFIVEYEAAPTGYSYDYEFKSDVKMNDPFALKFD